MKNDISQRSNNFIVKLWITNQPVYPSSSGFLRVLDRAWHGCTVGLIWLINCEITMHCTMSRFSPTFYFPMKFSPSCPGPGSPHDALRWAVTWRGAGWWHVTSTVSPVSPGLGVSCIFLWRRHFAIVAPCSEQGRQAAAWAEHRECDSRLLLPGLRSHNPIIRSQSHIMSPDTSTLLTLAWLVSDIASGQTGHIGYLIIDR